MCIFPCILIFIGACTIDLSTSALFTGTCTGSSMDLKIPMNGERLNMESNQLFNYWIKYRIFVFACPQSRHNVLGGQYF